MTYYKFRRASSAVTLWGFYITVSVWFDYADSLPRGKDPQLILRSPKYVHLLTVARLYNATPSAYLGRLIHVAFYAWHGHIFTLFVADAPRQRALCTRDSNRGRKHI